MRRLLPEVGLKVDGVAEGHARLAWGLRLLELTGLAGGANAECFDGGAAAVFHGSRRHHAGNVFGH